MFSTHMKPTEDAAPLEVWSRGCTDPSTISGDRLLARLAETVIWCEGIPDSEGYRTKALRPSLFHEGRDDLVCDVGSARQRQLHYKKLSAPSRAPVIAPGRFLVYFPDENLCDGYAESVSKGFFDVDNLPAYDTWVSFFDDESSSQRSSRCYLLCYVPVAAIDPANAGIEGNPEECIMWLEQSDVSIRRRVEDFVRRR
jgi:hypothetical protein